MKFKLVLLVFLMCLINSMSNAQIGIGTTSPNASAALDISSTSKGILFPRLTTIQRANIANPTAGMVIYCTNCGANGELQIYNGTAWLNPATNTAAAAIPILTTTAISNVSIVTANSGGTIVDEGSSSVTVKGVCWNTSANPTIANTKTSDGTGAATFTSSITSLNANTTYYVRAYATSASGTGYGDQLTFTTLPPEVASFATSTSSAITAYAATINSSISADNGATVTSRGICWSTNINPTTANNPQTSGSGIGSYSINITGLLPNTTYYVRSYAINSVGTGYSSQISFTTADIPTITTTAISNISKFAANSGATINNEGSSSVTAKGVCWSTTANPTTANSKTSDGTGAATFTSSITSLNASTTYYVRAYATNSFGTGYGDELTFTTLPPEVASFATSTSSAITAYAATINSTISADNGAPVTSRGVCWSTNPNPTTANNPQTNGSGIGSYSINITGLLPNTTYYVRSYAINSVGTGYGAQISFTTFNIPTVSAMDISNISKFSANSGGYVDDEGSSSVTAKGVCWSTTANPTTANSKTIDGAGAATFTSSITSLNVSTTYYVRAYATNSYGTGYGDQLTFTTLPPEVASFATSTSSAITGYSAIISSNITSNNGATVTSRGVCYSTTQNPTTANNPQTNGSGNGAYDITITSLLGNTTYYVRSYAINSAGTGYGAEISFTTGVRSLPTLTTSTANCTSTTTGTSGGNITSSGNDLLTARGVCWSTSQSPTIADPKSSDGTATGTYVSSITGLTPNTTYYVRAYATNSVGTAYGDQVSFISTPTLQGSLDFNGTSGYLGLSPGFTIGTGAFTIEGWFYVSSFTNVGLIGSSNTESVQLYFVTNQSMWAYYNSGGGYGYSFATPITANAWHYIVYNRNADKSTAIWIDGTNKCITIQIDNFNYSNATNRIGFTRGLYYFPGKLTNVRVSVGTAVYNSASATIANPTSELTSSAATKYLMLGGSITSDASNTQTVTNNGTVGLSALKPF